MTKSIITSQESMSEMLDPGTNVEKEPAAPDASVTSTPIGKVGPFASLRIRNFRFLLAGSLLFSVAGCIQGLGLNWLVYKMTGSGTILGSINMVLSATSLVMIPMSGVLVDRVDHRKLMFLKNIWMFAIVLGLGFLLLSGHPNISYLFAFAFLCGVIQTLNITLGQVVIFDLVPRIHTPNAIALLQTGGFTASHGTIRC